MLQHNRQLLAFVRFGKRTKPAGCFRRKHKVDLPLSRIIRIAGLRSISQVAARHDWCAAHEVPDFALFGSSASASRLAAPRHQFCPRGQNPAVSAQRFGLRTVGTRIFDKPQFQLAASLNHSFCTRRVAFTRHGEGPPILLIHGIHPSAWSYEWRNNVDSLARTNTVYTIDLLGFGRSDRPAIRYSARLYISLISDFVSRVIDEPTVLVARVEDRDVDRTGRRSVRRVRARRRAIAREREENEREGATAQRHSMFLGALRDAPADLSTNPEHFQGFGAS